MVYSQSYLARSVLFVALIVLFAFHKPLLKWKCVAYVSLIKSPLAGHQISQLSFEH